MTNPRYAFIDPFLKIFRPDYRRRMGNRTLYPASCRLQLRGDQYRDRHVSRKLKRERAT